MQMKMERPAAGGTANGANIEAAGFTHQFYRVKSDAATVPFASAGIAALRVLHLVRRHGVQPQHAAMLADLAYGEGRA